VAGETDIGVWTMLCCFHCNCCDTTLVNVQGFDNCWSMHWWQFQLLLLTCCVYEYYIVTLFVHRYNEKRLHAWLRKRDPL